MEQQPSRSCGGLIHRALSEIGIISIYESTFDTKLLCIQRFVRLFAYGGSTLVLASFLSALEISESRIGLFMTSTLIGDVIISFFLTLFGDALGRKRILALGALLMTLSGVIFATTSNFWFLLFGAIVGVISPSGNEIGPFRAIEESTLAHLTRPEVRSDVYAWYSLFGISGAAFGLMTCGWAVEAVQSSYQWDVMKSYRMVFIAYSAVGLVKFALACALSSKIEAEKEDPQSVGTESERLIPSTGSQPTSPPRKFLLIPSISSESKAIFVKLAILFALDSFASGLAAQSWVVYFFKTKFSISDGKLGSIFFTTSIIAALSTIVASSIAKRIGNVKTMVFTHLPSSIALAMIGFPTTLPFALVFLVIRSCTQQMDVAPRTAFLAAVIRPNERTAIMGSINVVKTFSQSLGPLTTGILAGANLFWVAFVMAGALKATYDLGMLATFAGHKTREEQEAEDAAEQEHPSREGQEGEEARG